MHMSRKPDNSLCPHYRLTVEQLSSTRFQNQLLLLAGTTNIKFIFYTVYVITYAGYARGSLSKLTNSL